VIVAVPADTPVNTPVPELTDAMLGALLTHEAAGIDVLLNDDVVPAHTVVVPVIVLGVGLMVTIAVAAQPVANV
jgi:hypothetical protein